MGCLQSSHGKELAASAASPPKLRKSLTLENGFDDDGSRSWSSNHSISQDWRSDDGHARSLAEVAAQMGWAMVQSQQSQGSKLRKSKSGNMDSLSPVATASAASTAVPVHGVHGTSMKGQKPESPNQDCWCVVRTSDFSAYGVFDGHGKLGHEVSNFVKNNLPVIVLRDIRLGTSAMPMVMRDAFKEMSSMIDAAHEKGTFNAQKSGTTATLIVHDHRHKLLTISHVGDSGAAISRGSNYKATYLTPDHKPNLPREKKRIESLKGSVVFDGYNYRVHRRGGYSPQLNMSRSFGDLWGKEAGIISEPDTTQLKLSSSDHFLLLCSDGVWEFTSAQDAVDIVREQIVVREESAAHALACAASDRWSENHELGVVDDITVVFVNLHTLHGSVGGGKPGLRRSASNLSCRSEDGELSGTSGGSKPMLRRANSCISTVDAPSNGSSGPKLKPALKRSDSTVSRSAEESSGSKPRTILKRSDSNVSYVAEENPANLRPTSNLRPALSHISEGNWSSQRSDSHLLVTPTTGAPSPPEVGGNPIGLDSSVNAVGEVLTRLDRQPSDMTDISSGPCHISLRLEESISMRIASRHFGCKQTEAV